MNTVVDITNKEYKNPSEILVSLMEQFSNLELNRGELIQKIVARARLEEIPTEQIRKMIEDMLRARGLSDRSIRLALPQELKHTQMIREQKPRQIQQESIPRQIQEVDTTRPIPIYHEQVQEIPVPTPIPEPLPTVTEVPVQQNNKRQPDYRIMKDGTIPEAFKQITDHMRQFNYRTDKCKMALLIFYE